jgi:hypothetical protein
MSTPRTFLRCDSLAHAEVVDQLVCLSLRDADGSRGTQWSGVYQKGASTYGILYASPVAALFDAAEIADRLETEIIDENGDTDWPEVEPAPPEEEPTP